MKNLEITEKDKIEYMQWQKDNGKLKYELTNVFINDNGEIKMEKQMAWVMTTNPEDWKQFCKVTGRKYKSSINLLMI